MAYDEELAQRFRGALEAIPNITEKKMMGGVCFMTSGNMIGGCDRQKDGSGRFMFRVGKENEAEALSRPGAIPLVNGTKRMGGLVFVDEDYCQDEQLREWVDLAMSFVGTLPPKAK